MMVLARRSNRDATDLLIADLWRHRPHLSDCGLHGAFMSEVAAMAK
jgi:hypothetical protein